MDIMICVIDAKLIETRNINENATEVCFDGSMNLDINVAERKDTDLFDYINNGYEHYSGYIMKITADSGTYKFKSIEEAAEALGVSESTIYRWLRTPAKELVEKKGFNLTRLEFVVKGL